MASVSLCPLSSFPEASHPSFLTRSSVSPPPPTHSIRTEGIRELRPDPQHRGTAGTRELPPPRTGAPNRSTGRWADTSMEAHASRGRRTVRPLLVSRYFDLFFQMRWRADPWSDSTSFWDLRPEVTIMSSCARVCGSWRRFDRREPRRGCNTPSRSRRLTWTLTVGTSFSPPLARWLFVGMIS